MFSNPWLRLLAGGLLIAWMAGLSLPGGCEEGSRADLYVKIDAGGLAHITFTTVEEPSDAPALNHALEQTLGGPLSNVRVESRDDKWILWALCRENLPRNGWLRTGEIRPTPLMDQIRSDTLSRLYLNITLPPLPYAHIEPEGRNYSDHAGKLVHYIPIALDSEQAPIPFAFGYRPENLIWSLALPVLIPLTAVGLALWARRKALNAPTTDPIATWFRYASFVNRVSNSVWILWAIAGLAAGLPTLVVFLLGSAAYEAQLASLLFVLLVPPVLTLMLLAGLSHPVYARIRGIEYTPLNLMLQRFWASTYRLFPLSLVTIAVSALVVNDYRQTAIWGILAYIAYIFTARQFISATKQTPQAITEGVLRDRLFGMAKSARVGVGQIYVLPAGQGRLANAYAMQGHSVMLTDYLLQNLSRREVDAVLAHELTHLREKHSRKLALALLLIFGIPALVVVLLNDASPLSTTTWSLLPLMILPGVAAFNLVSRRFERVADAGAVSLTGDPEALITGLAKIAKLNQMPMEWSRWHGGMGTHPTTSRRVRALAAQGGLSQERLNDLLSGHEPDTERYPLLADTAEEGLVFSSSYRGWARFRLAWTCYAVILLLPALVGGLAQVNHLEGAALWLAWFLGLALTFAAYLLALNIAPNLGAQALEDRLRERLLSKGIDVKALGGVFVGFTPETAPRFYEGFPHWDIGFLVLNGDRLAYLGELTRFALRRDQILDLRPSPPMPGWHPLAGLAISWQEAEEGRKGAFVIRPSGRHTVLRLNRQASALADRIRTWQAEASALAALPTGLEAPAFGSVTSVRPSRYGDFSVLFRSAYFLVLAATGLSLILGLSFDPETGGNAFYAMVTAGILAFLHCLPFIRYIDL